MCMDGLVSTLYCCGHVMSHALTSSLLCSHYMTDVQELVKSSQTPDSLANTTVSSHPSGNPFTETDKLKVYLRTSTEPSRSNLMTS